MLVIGLLLGRAWRLRIERGRAACARRLGRRGERAGLALLARAGYRLVATQPAGEIALLVDGAEARFPVRADALVTRGGRRYIAEIKAGPANATLSHRNTRRQILEYIYAFDADGVLLVDVPGRRVQCVEVEP
ncbi:MAG: hypothetical protein CVU56_19005 [Deltaproteobacteria bacterium HGW-Deltaproteobacteria-14]|nr:MAG: hypothetical protein CVU56_19005 [Deltaproteobacteria bacterium HGW-Deltaproteobacteria-14]